MPAAQVPAPLRGLAQAPLWHVSPDGQTFPHVPQLLASDVVSRHVPPQQTPVEQVEPSVFAGLEQTPVDASQVPASWHSSRAVQTTGAPAQLPSVWQTSPVVHKRPSSHVAPTLTENPQYPVGKQAAE